VKTEELIRALERFAPLPLQDGFDNAGLQVGLTEAEVSGALLCLDVTEEVLEEAVREDCNMVIAHHPLLFHPLKTITNANTVQRCVRYAIAHNLTIYAAHTNLDNAVGGVNYKIAEKLGLKVERFLQPRDTTEGGHLMGGSGILTTFDHPVSSNEFLLQVKRTFDVACVMHNGFQAREIQKVALCGGAGDFLLDDAISLGADAFLTGEMHYHQYFAHEKELLIAVIGHYQSEQYTKEIFYSIITETFPQLKVKMTTVNTNPINYLI
jgi:dinuclear metal center YbgI/SA1388 family protein